MSQTFYSIHDYYISHHGVKGQKWGIRRWQNLDGTLTAEGKQRYEKAKERWTDKNIVKRSNKAIATTTAGLGAYIGGLSLAVKLANPAFLGASVAASMALMLSYPVYDAIRTSRDNRMATLAKDEVLKKKIEDIRSDETGTRTWEVRRKVRWEKQLEKARRGV